MDRHRHAHGAGRSLHHVQSRRPRRRHCRIHPAQGAAGDAAELGHLYRGRKCGRVREARLRTGGKVFVPPFDVFDMGRMAVVQDPTGAAFCLWQAKQKANAVTGVDGTLCWADLNTSRPRTGEEILFQPVGMEIREIGARFLGLPAHQKWRAVHRRPSSSRTPRRRASPLACIHSGVRL